MAILYRFYLRQSSIILAFILAGSVSAFAQNRTDTTYIKTFPDQFTGRIYVGEKISVFNIRNKALDRELQYRPNNILGIGLGVTIKGIGFNFSTRLPFHGTKEELYGRTRRYDLQIHRYRGNWAMDGYAQRYRGFHLNSSEDVDSISGTTTYPYLPDLTTLNLGASAMYMFNGKKFTMRGAVNQQDWQLQSAGSFMVGAAFFARYIYDNESILPDYYKYPQIMDGQSIRHISNYGLTLRAGYGYNYVINEHYFIAAAADVGAGPGYSVARDVSGNEQTGWGLNVAANLRLATGYNAQKWFGGVYVILHAERYTLPYDQVDVNNALGIFRVVVARRFTTRKRLLREGTH
jgi:hypothetical protein